MMSIEELSSTYIFPGVVFIVMFGLGSALSLTMLQETLSRPRALVIGLIGQLILLPLLVMSVVAIGWWPAWIAIALLVVAVCPGASTSNAIVFALNSDLALSVSLTVFSSLITLFTIPFYLSFGFQVLEGTTTSINIPASVILKNLALMTVLPITLGIILQRYSPLIASAIRNPFRKLSLILILMIIALSLYNSRSYLSSEFLMVVFAALSLATVVVTGGYLYARVAGLPDSQRAVIAIEVGLQNTPLAIYIGTSLLGRPELSIVAIAYGIINYFLIGVMVILLKRNNIDISYK